MFCVLNFMNYWKFFLDKKTQQKQHTKKDILNNVCWFAWGSFLTPRHKMF